MRCANYQFRFGIPFFLLFVLLGLFVVIERRMEANVGELEKLIIDPVARQASHLQSVAWAIDAEAELLRENVLQPQLVGFIHNKLDQLKQDAQLLEEHTNFPLHQTKAHDKDLALFRSLPGSIHRLKGALSAEQPWTKEALDDIKKQASQIQHTTNDFNNAAWGTHQLVIGGLLASNAAEQKKRDILSVLIFMDSLLLFGFLFCNARSYYRKTKLVETAEHYSALFAATLQSTRVGVMIRNMQLPGQPVVYINNAFLNMTGYDLDVIGNQKPESLLGRDTDPEVAAVFREAVEQGKSDSFDLLIYRKDGSSFWSEWHINPLRDANGALTHYVSLLTDITGLRETQEALFLAKEQAEHAFTVKSNFLATMSHEIRTPLNGLLGVLDLLSNTRLHPDQRKLLDLAMTSSRALHEIINDILDISKMEAGKTSISPAPFALRDLLRDVVDLTQPLARGKNLDLKLTVQEMLPDRFISDAGRIRQILLNLLTNAVKFTDRGHIELRVNGLMTQEDNEEKTLLLRFDVLDTGIGIGSVDQDKLFREFSQIETATTRRYKGTGLGLAITRRLVELLNGEIGVDSKVGQGSKFWFMLPLAIDQSEPAVEPRPKSASPRTRKPADKSKQKILLVEDNETNRIVASQYLEKAGYPYDMATTGSEAVEKAVENRYSLILMDISMPVMDGFDATRQIRSLGTWAYNVPIIALTAHVMQGDRERCLAAGMNDYLGKPLAYDTLVRKLEWWLDDSLLLELVDNEPFDDDLTGTPDIDAAVLNRLVADLGENAMLRITQSFLDGLPQQMDVLAVHDRGLDVITVRETAHKLKSSSANCGLMRFSAMMADIEIAAAINDESRVSDLLKGVGAVYEIARQKLMRERKRYQG